MLIILKRLWATIPIDKVALAKLDKIKGVHVLDLAHIVEHSLEVQLPFLQQVLDEFAIVPIVAGDALLNMSWQHFWQAPRPCLLPVMLLVVIIIIKQHNS